MCMRRVDMDRLQELVRLYRLGTGKRGTARLLGMGPNTERDYREALEAEGLLAGSVEELPELEVLRAAVERRLATPRQTQMTSSVSAWEPKILKLAEAGLTPQPIFDRLKLEQPDFHGGFYAVWRRWKKTRTVSVDEVVIPVDTIAGEVAQVDFSYVGKLYDPRSGRQRKAWVFVMVLGYSRWMFAKVVFDQKVETWLKLHIDAFVALGGVPATIVPDNLKAAVVRAAFAVDDTPGIHRSYRELARYYGFKIESTPVCSPEKKGKVEAGVRYVKGNFFKGRAGADVDEVDGLLRRWLDEIANVRRAWDGAPSTSRPAHRGAGCTAAAATTTVRARAVASGSDPHRLSRRLRPPAVLGAVDASARRQEPEGLDPRDADAHRDLRRRQTGR